MLTLGARAAALAADRERGASALVAELLALLDDAVATGRDAVVEVARVVCAGQPAMAPIWNACGAALEDFDHPGHFAARRAEIARAPQTLRRAGLIALRDLLQGPERATVLTLSHSSSVREVLTLLAGERPLQVVCGESRPGLEGETMCRLLQEGGVTTELVPDAALSTRLHSATAVVVGADTIAAAEWINKCGTFGLAAAAWFTAVPVYVLSTRDKAACDRLMRQLSPTSLFDRVPTQLATLFLTEVGPVDPNGVAELAARWSSGIPELLASL